MHSHDLKLPFDPAPPTFRAHRVYGVARRRSGRLLCECQGRITDCRPAKHPYRAGWQSEGTSDRATIKRWQRERPWTNLGFATGESVGYFVLDLDSDVAITAVTAAGVPPTWQVRTGRGEGRHLYFAMPDFGVRNRQSVTLPGGARADVRGTGGYAIAPGSHGVSGNRYEWVEGRSPADVDLAPAPQWLLDALADSGNDVHGQGSDEDGSGRNTMLTRIGGGARRLGASAEGMMDLLRASNQRFPTPLDADEVEARAHLAARYHPASLTAGEQIALLRSLLERRRHLMPLSNAEFAVLVDGLLYVARRENSLTIRSSHRTLFVQTHVPLNTVGKTVTRLKERGVITPLRSDAVRGTEYRIEAATLVQLLRDTNAQPESRTRLTLLGQQLPISTLVPVEGISPSVLMYVPFRTSLRRLYRMGLDRSVVTLLGYNSGRMTLDQLASTRRRRKTRIRVDVDALCALGIVVIEDGVVSIVDEPEKAIDRAWRASGARDEYLEELAGVREGQKGWVGGRRRYSHPEEFNPLVRLLYEAGGGVHDLDNLIQRVHGKTSDTGTIIIPGIGLLDTETGEVWP